MSRYGKFIVSYDISSQRERSRVSKTLAGYGFRVQKSVFECLLTPAGKARLIGELDRLELATGYIYIYQLNNQAKRIGLGKVPLSPDSGYSFIV